MPSSSILLINYHALFRSSVALMLEMRLPRTTVSEASRIEEALAQACRPPISSCSICK
ncbi:DNA-binding response regulator [Pseudomonas syringae pv. maculicola str. ES4326]|uniref:DNA-binding response regulator n=1 Tax=Pseudomonas syringae pv. maculicola str. ES4326 TaxID=629265 RepID=A0A8T8C813_PSEYM|nr:DNA-binding response regulator [Pseudomonas syringae pv. maculicola str. ES4326]